MQWQQFEQLPADKQVTLLYHTYCRQHQQMLGLLHDGLEALWQRQEAVWQRQETILTELRAVTARQLPATNGAPNGDSASRDQGKNGRRKSPGTDDGQDAEDRRVRQGSGNKLQQSYRSLARLVCSLFV